METLFIGHAYIDVTMLAERIPTGDEKAVAKDYAVSFGGNAVTAGFACAKLGHPVDLAFMQRLVGVDLPTAAGIIGAALPTLDQKGLQAHWHSAFSAAIDESLPLKPGALSLLSARHRPMALVTSSGQAEAHHKLRVTGLAGVA